MRIKIPILAFIISLASASIALSSSTPVFSVGGAVREEDGTSAKDGLTVVVENQTKGLSEETTTDDAGKYSVAFVNYEGEVVAEAGDLIKVTVKNDSGKTLGSASHTVSDDDIKSAKALIDVILPGKGKSSITLNITPTALEFGGDIVLSGAITPNIAVEVTLILTSPDGKAQELKARTKADGTYELKFTPDKVGRWSAKATWEGNEDYTGCESPSVEFEVTTDFAIKVDESSKEVNPGGEAVFTLEIIGKEGFDAEVSLQVKSIPNGSQASFDKDKLKPGESCKLIVSVPPNAAEGLYDLSVVGTGGGITHELQLSLNLWRQRDSYLTLIIQPEKVEYGGKVTLSGELVLPQAEPAQKAGKEVALSITKPSGKIEKLETATDQNGEFEVEYEPDEIGRCTVKASWDGDERYKSSQSEEKSFQVERAKSFISWESIPGKTKVGEKVKIEIRLMPNLEGRSVSVTVKNPSGIGRTERLETGRYGLLSYEFTPDVEGVWRITVSWDGNELYKGVSDERSVSAAMDIGKAIILIGGVSEKYESEWERFNGLTNYVYKVLRMRGLTDDDIYYINPSYKQSEDIKVDALTSKAALEHAILDWASDKVNPHVPLFIYMVSHGREERFLLDLQGSPDSTLSSVELNSWLNQLEERSGVKEITAIIEACRSGSFVKPLAKEGRIIIASAREDKPSLVTPGLSFSRLLFRKIYRNRPLDEALTETMNELEALRCFREQFPMFDADGDGMVNEREDFIALEGKHIPADITTMPILPEITDASGSVSLKKGESSASFWVRVSGANVVRVWGEIVPPGFSISFETIDREFEQFELMRNPEEEGRYEGEYAGFTTPGTHTVIFYAEDDEGFISQPVQVSVTCEGYPWDVNGDGAVDILDLVIVGKNYGSSGPEGDVNGDGKVDILDLVLVGKHYGEKMEMGAPRRKRLRVGDEEVVGGRVVGDRIELERPMWAVVLSRGAWESVSRGDEEMEGMFAMRIGDRGMAFVGPGRPFNRLPLHALSGDAFGVTVDGRMVRIEVGDVPERTLLLPNYPNPFNPETWIPFRLAEDGEVVIRIYDMQGRLVRQLNLGKLEAGVYESKGRAAYWDGRNEDGEEVSSGIYMMELSVGKFRAVRRMCLMR